MQQQSPQQSKAIITDVPTAVLLGNLPVDFMYVLLLMIASNALSVTFAQMVLGSRHRALQARTAHHLEVVTRVSAVVAHQEK